MSIVTESPHVNVLENSQEKNVNIEMVRCPIKQLSSHNNNDIVILMKVYLDMKIHFSEGAVE